MSIGVILLAVILVHTAVALRREAWHARELARQEARLIGVVTERAIARAMTDGRSAEVQAILEEIGRVPQVTAIRILDATGTILRSSRPGEAGQTLTAEPARQPGQPEPLTTDAAPMVTASRPIPNRPACHACHEADASTLGFLDVWLDVPGGDPWVARQWTGVFPSILALIAAGGLVAAYFTLVVGRRIAIISRAMSRVEAGDLGARVAGGRRDELGRLGQSFNTMVDRLAEANRQLEARHADEIRRAEHLASLGKMAAGIAHEINNPLAGMQNCVRTLLRGIREDVERVQYLEMLREGLDRVGRTVRQLLDFARESRPRLAPTALPPLLHRSLALLEHELTARRISCALTVDSGLPAVPADAHQIEQVFLNILMNAVEAMPGGGSLGVTAGLAPPERGAFVEVAVTDTGAGIPPEHLTRVFDPFFTTKDVGKGTGLGLSVSYGIVRAHGGFIDVRSEVGKGSTFTVALPVAGEGEPDGAPDPPGGRRADPQADAGSRPG